jgi:predicted nucleotidyltransferase
MPVLTAAELEQKLNEVVRRLREAFAPAAIYFFGSYAYGTPRPGSDIDLLVVVEDSPLDPYERDGRAYLALMGLGIPKDVQVYTRAEFEQRAALPVSFERTVKAKGKLIYAA